MRDLTKLIQVTSIQTITHPAIWLLLIAILILFHQYVRYRLTYLFNKSYLSQIRHLTLESYHDTILLTITMSSSQRKIPSVIIQMKGIT